MDNSEWSGDQLRNRVHAAADHPLKALILYQDVPTREWAFGLWERVASNLEEEEGLQVRSWRISELAEPEALTEASSEAAVADVIVVATRDEGEVPAELAAWGEGWLLHRAKRPGSLVALIGVAEEGEMSGGETRGYLAGIAKAAGLDHMVRVRRFGVVTESSFDTEQLLQRHRATTRIMGDILGREYRPRPRF